MGVTLESEWLTGPLAQSRGLKLAICSLGWGQRKMFCLACSGFEFLFSFAFLWEQMFMNQNSHKKASFPEQHRRADLSSGVGPEIGCPRGEGHCAPVTRSPCQYEALGLLPAGPVGAVAPSKSRLAAPATCSW